MLLEFYWKSSSWRTSPATSDPCCSAYPSLWQAYLAGFFGLPASCPVGCKGTPAEKIETLMTIERLTSFNGEAVLSFLSFVMTYVCECCCS